MKLYAESPRHRMRQLAGDLLIAAWTVVWVDVGLFIHRLVAELAEPGATVETAGRRFAETLSRARANVEDIPVIGTALGRPFEAAAGAGSFLAQAGQDQQDAVRTLAVWLGVLLALIPIALVVGWWLSRRVRWIRQASAAHGIRLDPSGLRLFALRALATRPMSELRRASPNPMGDFDAGNYGPLARLELAALGLRGDAEGES